ncbi:MAG: hypothetical protein WKI04_02500 [Ferruginibacter sp.]
MSRLEKFIKDNRGEFDDQLPSEKLWQKVEAAVTKESGKRFLLKPVLKWSMAAAVLIIVSGVLLVLINKKNPAATMSAKETPGSTELKSFTPEEVPEMNQFARLIAGKQEEIKLIAKEQPELYNKFARDITQLDSSYNNLKNKLSVTPNREVLIEAMIQNLELQLSVLNQQLNIIQQIKQSKKNSHDKNKTFT